MTVTEHWVAIGPTAGTWWCTIDDPEPEQFAPGGVVLCIEQTITPHPDAERAAVSAWTILDRWRANEASHRRVL